MGWAGIWALARLFFSGAAERLLKGFSAAAKWLVADWRNLFVVIFGVTALWQGWVTIPARDSTIADTEALLADTQTAFVGTIVSYTTASAKAQADAEANAARVKAEQERITDAKLGRYRADLAHLRSRFARLDADRLRRGAGAGNGPRRADAADLPGAGEAPGRAAEASGQDRLPAARDRQATALSLDDALIASEQALQLNALIDWIEAQSAVRFNPEPRR